ncbi:uncharacterized protein Z519_04641 [Cladophialophora bantiana CBS 173.52]|uniref:Uncharacterized protein n=1 Tax=Cladophialophora bantiana (strain ATCC 10958 / CBS 173.52 / CDC B-1940 / NIH 8579) TaxID=1442370 RepID=A0A0D2ID30_CLAB1|nr:uncharacterized protein Z519_04641 [Cladophialophora bantiana CBS 173.52]KIW94664.1 hypothetical protein Z519_04641 [Cladophialophora bantiana CBS 173.52]
MSLDTELYSSGLFEGLVTYEWHATGDTIMRNTVKFKTTHPALRAAIKTQSRVMPDFASKISSKEVSVQEINDIVGDDDQGDSVASLINLLPSQDDHEVDTTKLERKDPEELKLMPSGPVTRQNASLGVFDWVDQIADSAETAVDKASRSNATVLKLESGVATMVRMCNITRRNLLAELFIGDGAFAKLPKPKVVRVVGVDREHAPS